MVLLSGILQVEDNMEHFAWPDIIIISVIALSIIIGLFRGFVKELISLATWILAIVLAVVYSGPLAQKMTFTQEPFIQTIAAFFVIFIVTVIIGAVVNYVIGRLVRNTPFSAADRILGSGFGLLRGVVLVTVVVLLAGLTPLTQADWWKSSFTVEKFESLAIWVKDRLPEEHAKPFKFPERTLPEKTTPNGATPEEAPLENKKT